MIKGPDGAPFLERYHLLRVPLVGAEVVLHRFVASDPDRGFHDHPWRWAAALLLAGCYDELIAPHAGSAPGDRYRRHLGPLAINRLDGRRFHRVLLGPNRDAWTVFVTGPRTKTWGFLAHPDAHRYDRGSSTPRDHYDRQGVARVLASGDAFADERSDVSFAAARLEYRPFTHAIEAPDADWFRRAPRGAALRRAGEACATLEAPLVGPDTLVVLLSGAAGAGKDFVANALASCLGERVHLIRIGDATKQIYAERTGTSLDRLVGDRGFKDHHRSRLTALYDELRAGDELFELRRIARTLAALPPRPRIVCVSDLRMRYELAWFRDRVPADRLIHVRLAASQISRARRGVARAPVHATETDLDGIAPDLAIDNERDGDAIATTLLDRLRGMTPPVVAALLQPPGSGWSNVRRFLAQSLSHVDGYDHEVLGRAFRVHPQVMSPRYSYSPTFAIEHWDAPALAGARVLDMGSGCGVLAVFAALAGAAHVDAVDINPHAVELTRINAERHGVTDRVRAIESDGFAAVADHYDVILFNAPYFDHPWDPAVPLTRGVFDPGHAFLSRVLAEAPRYLTPRGRLLLVLGSTGLSGAPQDGELLDRLSTGAMEIAGERSETRGHRRTLYTLVPRARAGTSVP